jgi:competence protein ComEA
MEAMIPRAIPAAVFLGTILTGLALAQAPSVDWKEYLPEGPAKELTASRCSGCHELNTIVKLRKPAWQAIVSEMVSLGTPLTPEEEAQIVAYLNAAFGFDAPPLTDVNLASATDLIKLPGITQALADRIVAHRTTVAPFASRDEVKGVTGLDEESFDRIKWYIRAVAPEGKPER